MNDAPEKTETPEAAPAPAPKSDTQVLLENITESIRSCEIDPAKHYSEVFALASLKSIINSGFELKKK